MKSRQRVTSKSKTNLRPSTTILLPFQPPFRVSTQILMFLPRMSRDDRTLIKPIILSLPLHILSTLGIISLKLLRSISISNSSKSLKTVEPVQGVFLWTVVAAPVSPYLGRDGSLVVPASDEHVGTAAGEDIMETLEEGAFLGAIGTTVARPDNLDGAVGSRF